MLDLQEFTDQFYKVDVYGATSCKNTERGNEILMCSADSMIDIIHVDCETKATTADELALFGYQSKIQLSLSVKPDLAEDSKSLKFPQDSQVQCQFRYYAPQDAFGTKAKTLLINVLQRYGQHYDPDTNHVTRVPLAAE